MDDFQHENGTGTTSTHFRMDSGAEVLTAWGENAGQAHKNAVYRILFSVLDGSLFRTHNLIEGFAVPSEFFVVLKHDLVVKLRVHAHNSFGIVYIGPWDRAPGVAPERE
jgi:uncharacterized protein DUF6235